MLSTTSGMEHMGIHSLPSSRRKKHVRIKPPKFFQKCETEASRWRDNTTTHQVPFLQYLCSSNIYAFNFCQGTMHYFLFLPGRIGPD